MLRFDMAEVYSSDTIHIKILKLCLANISCKESCGGH